MDKEAEKCRASRAGLWPSLQRPSHPPSFLSIGDGGGVGPHLVGVAVLLLGA